MKTYLFLLFAALTALPAYPQNKGTSWTDVKNKAMITPATARNINTFDASDPESITRFFYASWVRKNQDWRKVVHKLDSEWTAKMKSAMNAYAQYTFKKIGLQKFRKMFDTEMRFSIYYEAMLKGKLKKGSGEVVLQKTDNKWIVQEVPA